MALKKLTTTVGGVLKWQLGSALGVDKFAVAETGADLPCNCGCCDVDCASAFDCGNCPDDCTPTTLTLTLAGFSLAACGNDGTGRYYTVTAGTVNGSYTLVQGSPGLPCFWRTLADNAITLSVTRWTDSSCTTVLSTTVAECKITATRGSGSWVLSNIIFASGFDAGAFHLPFSGLSGECGSLEQTDSHTAPYINSSSTPMLAYGGTIVMTGCS